MTSKGRNLLAGLIIGAGVLIVVAGVAAVTAFVFGLGSGAISAGGFPDALALSQNGRTLYVADDNALAANGVVWPLDLATGHSGRSIRVHGPAMVLALAPGGRTLYAGDGDSVTPIDLVTGRTGPLIRTHIDGEEPLLVSRDGRTLYLAGDKRIREYDLATGRFGPDIRADFPGAMLLSQDGRALWFASFDNRVVEVNLATGEVERRIRLRSWPIALAMSPNDRTLYAAESGSGRKVPAEVVPIDLAAGSVGPGTKVRFPVAMTIAPDGRTLYVLATPGGTEGDGPTVRGWVTPIDLATGKARPSIGVGYAPACIVITPNGRTLYVANEDDGTISVIHVRR
ncbi:MAG TPA: hypothetical protein VFI65_06245 [Streptosporangiaceae bacterium]|nr:hypothetical protein [Streptosporangiaceae bacterium]